MGVGEEGYGPNPRVYSSADYDALAAEFKVLAERYAKLQTGEDGVVARVVAERDAALAELAALKGGHEVAQYQYLSRGETARWWNIEESDAAQAKAEGFEVRELFASPPAQASAWVPASERLPDGWSVRECCDMEADIYGLIVSSPRVDGVSASNSVWPTDTDPAHLLLWHLLAAAPTPGASDGKGGKP